VRYDDTTDGKNRTTCIPYHTILTVHAITVHTTQLNSTYHRTHKGLASITAPTTCSAVQCSSMYVCNALKSLPFVVSSLSLSSSPLPPNAGGQPTSSCSHKIPWPLLSPARTCSKVEISNYPERGHALDTVLLRDLPWCSMPLRWLNASCTGEGVSGHRRCADQRERKGA
jgi:hypothetical protein